VVERLGLPGTAPDLNEWSQIVERIKSPSNCCACAGGM